MKYSIIIIIYCFTILSCKKGTVIIPAASVTVINASPGIANAKFTTPYTGYFAQVTGINYKNNTVFTFPEGSVPVAISSATDTTKPFYNTTIPAIAGTIYSLYIAGSEGGDVLLNTENFASHPDSSFGVRFINLSYNSNPVSVVMSTSTTPKEFDNISYKNSTDFKTYPATTAVPLNYKFDVIDQDGVVLATSPSINTAKTRFNNVTLVFAGDVSAAPSLILVNNF